MKRIFTIITTLVFSGIGFAQSATKLHTVVKGETVTQIAKKYNTTNNVLFLLNPEAVDGISENQTLKVPLTADLRHTVQPKETIYGIAKQYNIAIEKLYDLNPGLKEYGLKIGDQINLIANQNILTQTTNTMVNNTKTMSKIVEKGETIYGIAVQNNTTVSVLYELNPGLQENGLKEGQSITVPLTKQLLNKVPATNTITVKPKETIYGIAKTHNISQEKLLELNPVLKNGLKEGQTLIVGTAEVATVTQNTNVGSLEKTVVNTVKADQSVNLSLPAKTSTRNLVMLLPFNTDHNNFNNPSINQNLKENTFLNMTLDFYSGAKMAIEQLKSKNYNLNIEFIDSKESNKVMDVSNLKNQFNFADTDVIIGPFFQRNVDAVSESFKNQQTIIVSPLSTDKGKPYPHQVHTMPNADIVKKEVLEYVLSKQSNVVAITDGKKTNANYFNSNFSDVKVLSVKYDDVVNVSTLKGSLSLTDENYVIYDTTSLTTSIELIKSLRSLLKDYKITLVSLEKLEVLESSEINMADLTALKYTFPSITNDAVSTKKSKFEKDYRTVYGKNPSRFATRGYDVTYDVITRMFESDDNSNIFDYGTQQIENKFAYINENGGVYNNAVYILYYDTDLTIKEAK